MVSKLGLVGGHKLEPPLYNLSFCFPFVYLEVRKVLFCLFGSACVGIKPYMREGVVLSVKICCLKQPKGYDIMVLCCKFSYKFKLLYMVGQCNIYQANATLTSGDLPMQSSD